MTSSTYRNKKSYSVDTYYTSPILVYHCSTYGDCGDDDNDGNEDQDDGGGYEDGDCGDDDNKDDHRGHHALLEVLNASSSSSLSLFNSKLKLYLDYIYIAINT